MHLYSLHHINTGHDFMVPRGVLLSVILFVPQSYQW